MIDRFESISTDLYGCGQAQPLAQAKALYDYARQTDEELSFSEDALLSIYDTSDPDWTLVGAKGEFGFAPANYIEETGSSGDGAAAPPPMPARSRPVPQEPEPLDPPTPESSPSPVQQTPAAALAGIIQQRTGGGGGGVATRRPVSPPAAVSLPPRNVQFTPDESEEEAPAPRLPQRPLSEAASPPPQARNVRFQSPTSPEPSGVLASPPHNRHVSMAADENGEPLHSPGGYHIYNIYEMVEVLGKSKKMPVTLGINIAKGIIMISAEKERSSKEWSADKLTHYSIEGKHVFMELVRPSKSIDFHAGAKDTAQEIVGALGELAGAARGEGLKEIYDAASRGTGNTLKKGKMIYDFMAQGDDEVSVAEGDEVIVLDDSKSEEWWMVRRMKNGKEGVVPSNYVDIIGTVPASVITSPSAAASGLASPPPMSPPLPQQSHRSIIEQNRAEEERLAKQAAKKKKEVDFVPPTPDGSSGLQLPKRHSSLMAPLDEPVSSSSKRSSRDKRQSRDAKSDKKSMPNASKLRTWTDRSGSFKVEAEFLGLRDEKIHLHKTNGVKIAVPVPKMSVEDLEFVERATGISLDELKPLSDIKRQKSMRSGGGGAGASVGGREGAQKKEMHDWFDFFLSAGVDPQICERYSQAFNRDNIGEENLEDITPSLLRTLGFKEGDILRVMKALDAKFARTRAVPLEQEAANGSLFSGPGGALKNNTAKGRPVPALETRNELDPSLLRQGTASPDTEASQSQTRSASSRAERKETNGFDDNAWEPRASKAPARAATASPPVQRIASPPPAAPQPSVTPGMAEMSLLSAPLQPTSTPAPQIEAQPTPSVATPPPTQPVQVQPTGASPSLFEQLAAAKANPQPPRQRPNQPAQNPAVNSLISPPPGRSASAPMNPQGSGGFAPPPLQPQLTGYGGVNMPLRMQTTAVPGGQSLLDIDRQRILLQQQNAYLQSQPTGFPGQQFGQNGLMAQPTGFPGQQQYGLMPQATGFQGQQFGGGNMNASPFADPPRGITPFQPQATGFAPQNQGYGGLQPQPTGVNAFLPPALVPQATGMPASSFNQPQQNQYGGAPGQQTFSPPPMPPMPPQQQAPAALVPQKTGPPPPVRFGTNPAAKRLVSQPTGRANLRNASEYSPYPYFLLLFFVVV